MAKYLTEAKFEELRDRTFRLFLVVEMLCEVCEKPLDTRKNLAGEVLISNREDHEKLLNRASVHDRAEVDPEKCEIYFCDHDLPGDVHPKCLERLYRTPDQQDENPPR